MAKVVPESKEEYTQIEPTLKANTDWIKATKHVQISIMQDPQLLLEFMANKGNTMTNDPMSGVITHLMTNIKEMLLLMCWHSPRPSPSCCWRANMLIGMTVALKNFRSRLDSIKAVLNTTKPTKDIGNRIICCVGMGMQSLLSGKLQGCNLLR